jgi:proteasome lid subunit RPN8/RPN11
MAFRLVIPRGIHDQVLTQALAEQPNECVGLLAGVVESGLGRVSRAYPLPNALASPTRYDGDPRALLQAHRDMREAGLDLLAVYHSHPTAPAVPSATDHAQWVQGPDVACLIVTLLEDPPGLRGWWLDEGRHAEAEWEVA